MYILQYQRYIVIILVTGSTVDSCGNGYSQLLGVAAALEQSMPAAGRLHPC
jgi:hypothetical protein